MITFVTRAEFVVVLMNALNQRESVATNLIFKDKAAIGTWAITAIEKAVQDTSVTLFFCKENKSIPGLDYFSTFG